MVDLTGQYEKIQAEIDTALLNVVKKGAFINGEEVTKNNQVQFLKNHSKRRYQAKTKR